MSDLAIDYEKIPKIAVDFDGTVVDHRYPDVGANVPGAVPALKELQKRGYRILLFTMRHGAGLKDAVGWYKNHGIELYGVNRDPDQDEWTDSPKCFAHMYVDDAALGTPMRSVPGFSRPCVNWPRIMDLIFRKEN